MTPTENRQLTELTLRLFGEDGEAGALGRIESKIDGLDGRVQTLESDRQVREAVAAAGSRIDAERSAKRRWQITTVAAIAVGALGLVVQVAGAIGVIPS